MEKKWRRIGKGETIPTSSIIRPINGGLPNITGSRVMMGQDCYYLSVDDAYELLKGLPLETEAETKERNDATIIKKLIGLVKETDFLSVENRASLLDWLEKQGEQKPCMIQWKGDNLKEVIDFTGKDKNFEKWFKSFEEYEKYVGEHNGIFKLFNEDGSHYEVPVGAWIVKTPDGRNVASKAVFKQKPAWSEEDERILHNINVYMTCAEEKLHMKDCCLEEAKKWLKYLKERVQPKQEWSDEDEKMFINLVAFLECIGGSPVGCTKAFAEWLKERYKYALPLPHWKPSDEQMKVLDVAIKSSHLTTAEYNGLVKLREQLKKL